MRGRLDSEGTWTPYDNHEDTDGYDTIDWIIGRPWSDGRVAAAGSSYGAFAAFMAALSGHPALKAIVARVPATGLFHRHFYHGGIFSLARLAWGTSVNRRVLQESPEFGTTRSVFEALIAERPEVLLHLPVAEIGDLFPMRLPWWRSWLQHQSEDEFWQRLEVAPASPRFGFPCTTSAAGTTTSWSRPRTSPPRVERIPARRPMPTGS